MKKHLRIKCLSCLMILAIFSGSVRPVFAAQEPGGVALPAGEEAAAPGNTAQEPSAPDPENTAPLQEDTLPENTLPSQEDTLPENTSPSQEDTLPENTAPSQEDTLPENTPPTPAGTVPELTIPETEILPSEMTTPEIQNPDPANPDLTNPDPANPELTELEILTPGTESAGTEPLLPENTLPEGETVRILSAEYSRETFLTACEELITEYALRCEEAAAAEEEKPTAEQFAKLNETETKLYEALREEIAAIVAGERDNTEIALELPESLTEKAFSAEDLSLTVLEAAAAEEIYEAFFAAEADYKKILWVLFTDLPEEELYWADHAAEGAYRFGGLSLHTAEGETVVKAENAVFMIKVSEAYRAEGMPGAWMLAPVTGAGYAQNANPEAQPETEPEKTGEPEKTAEPEKTEEPEKPAEPEQEPEPEPEPKPEPVQYKITYKLNGGKNNAANPATYTVTTAAIKLQNPTRTGYAFAGWYEDAAFKKKITVIPKGSTGNKTLYAKWMAEYKITYKLNGGKNNAANPATYTIATADITLKNPSRTGYQFGGWYSDAKLTKKVTGIPKGSTGNKTFYAKWTIVTYKITYNLKGGKNHAKNPATYKVTSAAIKFQNPTRTGYKFAGWYEDAKYKTKITGIPKGSAGHKTLYAKWTAVQYKITYNLNGGKNNANNPATYTIATADITLKNPSRTGYKFGGWYSDAKFKNRVKTIPKKSKGNITLYAKWSIATYSITYKLNGGKNNAKNPATYQVKTATITLKNPTRTGYTFGGWYADATYKTRVKTIAKGSAGNKTLYAKWTPVEYKITYKLNAGTQNSKNPATYTIATADITLAAPSRAGYTFGGWYADAAFKTRVKKIPKGSMGERTLYAKWTVNPDATAKLKTNKNTLNVLDFGAVPGDGKDDTQAFNDAIAALGSKQYPNAHTLYVPGGTFDINAEARGIRIESRSNVTICMESNTVLKAIPTAAGSYSIIYAYNSDRVTLIGGQLKGERSMHKGSDGEWGMGILASATTNLSVINMKINDCWGDGIYLGGNAIYKAEGYILKYCNQVMVSGCTIHNNRRDNISITGAHNVTIDGSKIYDANGVPGQIGILIEPNLFRNEYYGLNTYMPCKNITISNSTISSYKNIKGTSRPDRQHLAIASVLISEYLQNQINWSDEPVNYSSKNVTLQNCTVNGDVAFYSTAGIKINGSKINGTVEYTSNRKVTFSNSNYQRLKQF